MYSEAMAWEVEVPARLPGLVPQRTGGADWSAFAVWRLPASYGRGQNHYLVLDAEGPDPVLVVLRRDMDDPDDGGEEIEVWEDLEKAIAALVG